MAADERPKYAEDILELRELWSQLDLEDRILTVEEVAVMRMNHLAPWKKIIIVLFALAASFELAMVMSRDWVLAFSIGILFGLACGLVVRKL